MKEIRKHLNLLMLCLAPWVLLPAQEAPGELTLEDIYTHRKYPTLGYRAVQWMPDNRHYTTLEENASGTREIIRYNAETGEREVWISGEMLSPPGSDSALQIRDYSWTEDLSRLLLFTNTRRVWRYHTRGDYWVLDPGSGTLRQLGIDLPEASLMFAKFSPRGDRVGYVSGHNLYVEDLSDGKVLRLTDDGGDRFVNGTFDWVYEEEFGCRDGFRWSEDGRHIAYWHSDTEGTGTFYMINNLDSVYSRPLPFPYPKVGTTNSAVKIGVVSSTGGATRWFDIPGDPRNHYLVRMQIIPGAGQVMIQQLNRLQNTNRVWVGDLETMELENILTETDDAFLDVQQDPVWIEEGRYFTWISERDGWRHLYLVSRDGSQVLPVTRGEFDLIETAGLDETSGFLYYMASPEEYTRRYLYRCRLDGKGTPERISPEGQTGHHRYVVSGDTRWALHTFENASSPPVISLVALQRHKTIRVLEENRKIRRQATEMGWAPKEFFRVDIGEVVLDAWMLKPPDFDPGKTYPLIFVVYGEPAGSTVQDTWSGGDLWHRFLASQGYVVMSVDNRGTKVHRGRQWRKIIYRQIGILAAKDQAAAARKILEMFPYLDNGRVGMWGWSGGGSMTLNCMFRYPSLYKTGIAIAFVSHQKLYDTAYQERYMGLPGDNAEGYREGSPITHAAGLEGNLLLIHGTADDNVHYQSFEWLVDELIRLNKTFDMMSYPMRTHAIRERENTSRHLRETMWRYWQEHLPSGHGE